MNIGIVGGGSIGLLIGSYLSSKHCTTIYVRRKEQQSTINQKGLIRDNTEHRDVQSQLINELRDEDCVFICVKQTQLKAIIPFLQQINSNIPLIFLQNGMGHIELIKSLPNPLYVGVVEHGALRTNDHQVSQTGKGLIRLATLRGNDKQLYHLLQAMNHVHFPMEVASHWKSLLSEKLIVNAVINPLTTIFEIKNREVIENHYVAFLAKQLCKETANILHLNETNEWERIKKIAKITGDNTSSMLVDMNNKQKTELEAITGYLLNKSKGEIPYTSFVYNSIKALEVKNGIY